MCKASCTYISYSIRCLFTMFLLNVQPIGFWVEESLHLSPSCVHDYGILHWTFEPLAMFFDQESCLIWAAYLTYIYPWGKLCNHKCPHSLFVWSLFLMKKESQTRSIVGSVCLSGCNLPHPPPHSCCSLLACMSDGTTFVSTSLQPISSAFWFCFHAILSPL